MAGLGDRQKAIVDKFSQFKDWEEKYKYIIELGKALQALSDALKNEDLKVKGCQSQVWLKAEQGANEKITFQADSDAVIVKGLIALLLKVYSDATPDEILASPPHFIQEIDLGTHLSPSRANGLGAMVKQIMHYAIAFQAMAKRR